MPLRPLDDTSAADWYVEADADWWTKVCLGPPGFDAYARLQLIGHDDLARDTTSALRRVLPSSGAVYFGQWTGCGWEPPLQPSRVAADLVGEVSPGVHDVVRDYHLFVGELADLSAWDELDVPHLMWPDNHAWFVAADVDPDWIGVGGSQELIDELVDDERLDAECSTYEATDWEDR